MTPIAKQRTISIILLILFSALAIVVLFPLVALLMSSFRPGSDLLRFGISLDTMMAEGKNLDNYKELLFGKKALYPFWFKNSIVILLLQTSITVFLTSLVGYGLAVYEFKGRRLLTTLVIVLMMVPLQILILPLYKMLIGIHLMDTIGGVILPFILSPVAIFFFRQFSLGLPLDLMDAARIDGVGEIGIYFRIMSPLLLPAYGAMAILEGLKSWNNYLWPLIVLRSTKSFTIPIGLNTLLTPYGNNYDNLISGAVIATIPIIILFLMFQRYFISGLSSGSVKG